MPAVVRFWQEVAMPDKADSATERPVSGKRGSGSDKDTRPAKEGGDPVQNAQKWGGGSKASKGPINESDRRNPNSSQRS
jgi:hypothetical protein